MALRELLTNLEEGIQSYPNHNTPSTSGGFNYGQSSTRIFDSKTFRQRSYKFGEGTAFDRPGNEFSQEPLIGRNIDIPGPNDQPGAGGFLNLIGSLTDGFVRGGIVTAIERSAQDVARLTKFYLTSRGIGFLAKQTALQLTNPRIPVGSTTVFGLELDRNRTFNLGLNILAQAGVNFSGIHFDRSGATPIFPEEDKYERYYTNLSSTEVATDSIGEINRRQGITGGNRLLTLYDSAILGNGEGTPEDEKGKLGQFVQSVGNKIKELTGRGGEELFAYNGGPDSLYGIGKTRILRATNTRTEALNTDFDFQIIEEGTPMRAGYIPATYRGAVSSIDIYYNRLFANNPQTISLGFPSSYTNAFGDTDNVNNPFAPSIFARVNGDIARMSNNLANIWNSQGFMTYDTIMKAGISDPDSNNIRDFRSRKRKQGVYRVPSFNYQKTTANGKKFIREQRVNLGNPGQLKLKHGFAYNVYDERTVDKINALDIIRVKDGAFTDQRYRDLIRFRIEAVDADKPTESDVMVFRAFLDDYSDNFNATWNNFTYNGRGEELYTYQGFKRDVSFSFKIAAQSRHEMIPLYRKLNFLVSQTAPDYKGTRMRGNFVKVTIGSLLDRTPGIINSVNLKWQKDYPFEIAIDSPENGRDTEMQVLPHVLDVSVSFTPVHNFLPKKSITDSPFIFLHERNGKIPDARKWYRRGAAENLDEASIEGQHSRGLGTPLADISSIPEESVANDLRKKEKELEEQRQRDAEALANEPVVPEDEVRFSDIYPDDDEFDDMEIEEELEEGSAFAMNDNTAIAAQNQDNKDQEAKAALNNQADQTNPTPKAEPKIDTGIGSPTWIKQQEEEWKKEKEKQRQAALNARGNVRT
jgi:hypothetical protein